MSIVDAIILGLIQGVSEFLPISSTGHLTLAGKWMRLINPEHPQEWTAFIAVMQLGTLAAVLLYFREDILGILSAFFRENLTARRQFSAQSRESRLGWYIIIGTLPIVAIGLLFKHQIEGALTKNLWVIGSALIALAAVLAVAEKVSKHQRDITAVTVKDALIVGFAQACALIPGASRSGTTITGALFAGLKRDAAARFSFLLSIPAVAASGLLELKEAAGFLNGAEWLPLAVATLVAGLSGYAAIDFLMKYLKKHNTFVFVWYRIALGAAILVLLSLGIITP